MKRILSLVLCALIVFVPFAAARGEDGAVFRFRPDGSFRILHLTDTQDDAHPAARMTGLIKKAIEFSDPDLIVFTGDLVEDMRYFDAFTDEIPFVDGVNASGADKDENTRRDVEVAVDAVLSVFERYEIPYVIALGNNDRKVGVSSEDWARIFSGYPHCVFYDESDDTRGGVDYHVTVKGSDGSDKLVVWLMDTFTGGLSAEQIAWYETASDGIRIANGGEPVPAFVFQHIQAADIGNLFEDCRFTDEGAIKSANGWRRLRPDATVGEAFFSYEACEPTVEFSAWKRCGDVMGAFFGHQHVEGFSGVYDGIEMGFTYGLQVAKSGPYGFRVIDVYETAVRAYENTLYRFDGLSDDVTAVVSEKPAEGLAALFMRLRSVLSALFSAIVFLFR